MNNESRKGTNFGVKNESTTTRIIDIQDDQLPAKTLVDVHAVTRLFAQQNLHDVPSAVMNQVSADDREKSLYEVHGVFQPIEETPEMVEKKMAQLATKLLPSYNSSYCRFGLWENIQQEAPEFTERLMLSCLRTEAFDVEKSVIRVIQHLQTKQKFFGKEVVGKDLGIADLNPLDREALNDGIVQVLRKRDRSGRAIIAQFTREATNYPVEVVAKLLFWSGMMVAREHESQQRGFVYILCSLDDKQPAIDRVPAIVHSLSSMPVRVAAFHFCTLDIGKRDKLSEAATLFGAQLLCRFNSHFGTALELRHNLLTFGIPMDVLPIMDDNTMDLNFHSKWVRALESAETMNGDEYTNTFPILGDQAGSLSPVIVHPNPHDVLLGRGSRWKTNPGNQGLRRILEDRFPIFDAARRLEKASIVNDVYLYMRAHGVRFLVQEEASGTWSEVIQQLALDRISHGFRNVRLASIGRSRIRNEKEHFG